MQTVLEVNPPETEQVSNADIARTSDIIEARGQLRIILAASEKITRMIDDLIDLIFWSTTGVPTVSVLEIRTISVKEMVNMAFSRVEESLNIGGFLEQDSIKTEYNSSVVSDTASASISSSSKLMNISMRLEIDDGFPEWIQVDRNKIMRVLKHLIRNACQAVGSKGEVIVRVSLKDGDATISDNSNISQTTENKQFIIFSVIDNGSGITKEACKQLFVLNSDHGDPSHEGAGMGLVVSKGLVQSMSGDLWLENTTVGKGSEFCVRIPLYTTPQRSTSPTTSNPSATSPINNSHNELSELVKSNAMELDSVVHDNNSNTIDIDNNSSKKNDVDNATDDITSDEIIPVQQHRQQQHFNEIQSIAELRVLVVEDNFVVRKLIVRMLGRLGLVNVVECENGLVAVQQCQKDYYDLVLMDCGMPVMDGFEASRQIRKMYGTPVDNTDSSSKEIANSCQSCQENQCKISKSASALTYCKDALPRMRIVAVTANASYAHRQRVLQSGIDYCILKPIRFDDLQEVVRQLATERNFAFKNTI
ncbi:hypothetical protein BDF19DRAFT_238691 [Syncephalis fuscata]|nr:hypothetical protein BDF19DRAFT_238691 [Syncephalis fuscata]